MVRELLRLRSGGTWPQHASEPCDDRSANGLGRRSALLCLVSDTSMALAVFEHDPIGGSGGCVCVTAICGVGLHFGGHAPLACRAPKQLASLGAGAGCASTRLLLRRTSGRGGVFTGARSHATNCGRCFGHSDAWVESRPKSACGVAAPEHRQLSVGSSLRPRHRPIIVCAARVLWLAAPTSFRCISIVTSHFIAHTPAGPKLCILEQGHF